MGSDDIFKKRRAARKQRRHEYKNPKANSFLIVTEGERTEPLYFKGMQKLIKEKTGGDIEVAEAPVVDIYGKGCGTGKGYKVAWSNQSFEYWLYLHFRYNDSALHREQWKEKLDEIFREYNLGTGKYQKNYENIYELVNINDGVDTAIKNAKRRMAGYEGSRKKPSDYDPGTTVYKLVEELKRYLDEE